MKKNISVLLVCFVLAFLTACKKDTEKTEKTEKQKTETATKPEPKPKEPKIDPLKIIAPAPEGMTAKQVLATYFQKVGGEDLIKKVKTLSIKSSSKGGGDNFEMVEKFSFPDKFFYSTAQKGEVFSRLAFNGKTGYDEYEGERVELSSEDIEDYKKKSNIFPDFEYKKGKLIGIAQVKGGNKAYVVEHEAQKIYYDVNSGLKVLFLKIKQKKDSEKIVMKTRYGNYKDTKFGLKFPFSIYEKQAQQRGANIQISEILVNEGVSDKDFE